MEFNKKIKYSGELAEIIGIIMGDGGLYLDRLNKYQITVAFNKKEEHYLKYVKRLFEDHFNYKFCISKGKDEFLLRNNSVFVGDYLIKSGIKCGNKINNKVVVPNWISRKEEFLLRFIKGFFDTDGCVYRKYGKYAQIQIKLGCEETISSISNVLIKLGFKPTRIQKEYCGKFFSWKIYLTRQKEIEKFFKKVKPRNQKHNARYQKIINGDTGIRTQISALF